MKKVTVRIEDGIARITVDDGKVNAMSTALMNEILAAFEETEQKATVVVLRGRAGIFSAGFDFATFKRGPEATVEMLRTGAALIGRLLAFPRPVLAVCTGHAYPMGAFLLLASDVRYGLAGPYRLGLNETAIGLTLPQFAVELARHRLSRQGFARIASGALFSPDEAAHLGYLDRVFVGDVLEVEVNAEANRLRGLDPTAFAGTKARVNAQAIAAVAAGAAEELTGAGRLPAGF